MLEYFFTQTPPAVSVAVFGESGSGKTTLLSVFYGHQQSAGFVEEAGYSLLAVNASEGQQLLNDYHCIADDLLPPQTRFFGKRFEFGLRPRGLTADGCRITWHDYPGEWWTESRTAEEADRKQETFRSLLGADVALVLVDGQQFAKHDVRYLARLFKGLRDELARTGPILLNGGGKFKVFPRVWVIALSKADLFPGKDAGWFRTQVMRAESEVRMLREQIQCLVHEPERVSLGQDCLLLSAAQFDPSTGAVVDPQRTMGIDLITPLAVVLPLLRTRKWLGWEATVFDTMGNAVEMLAATLPWLRRWKLLRKVIPLVEAAGGTAVLKLRAMQRDATARGDAVEAVIAGLESRLCAPGVERVFVTDVRR